MSAMELSGALRARAMGMTGAEGWDILRAAEALERLAEENRTLKKRIQDIESAESPEKAGWIRTKDALPEEGSRCLVWGNGMERAIMLRYVGRRGQTPVWMDPSGLEYGISHWMALPAPPDTGAEDCDGWDTYEED